MNKSQDDLASRIDEFFSAFVAGYRQVAESSTVREKSELPFFTDREFSIHAYVSQDGNVLLIFSEADARSVNLVFCREEKEFLRVLNSKIDQLGLLLRVNHLDRETGNIIGRRKAQRDSEAFENRNRIVSTKDQIDNLKVYVTKTLGEKVDLGVETVKTISDQFLALEGLIRDLKEHASTSVNKAIFNLIPDMSLLRYGLLSDSEQKHEAKLQKMESKLEVLESKYGLVNSRFETVERYLKWLLLPIVLIILAGVLGMLLKGIYLD